MADIKSVHGLEGFLCGPYPKQFKKLIKFFDYPNSDKEGAMFISINEWFPNLVTDIKVTSSGLYHDPYYGPYIDRRMVSNYDKCLSILDGSNHRRRFTR